LRVVAIVNGSALRVRGRIAEQLHAALPGGVRVTRSLDEARDVVHAEVARGVDVIVLGGGDGTVVMGMTLIAEACRGANQPEPAMGVLKLGSGNAIADSVGASKDVVDDLRRLARGEGERFASAMIDVLGVRAPFVGMGLDAQFLEDHEAMNRIIDRVPGGRRFLGGGARYTLSVALRSIPRFARTKRPQVVVTNTGAPAPEVGRHGPTGKVVGTGEVLWRGAATMVAGSTIPFFGFGLQMFAHATARPDRFQLRCADPGFLEALRVVPAAFRGEYFSAHTHDFLCDRAVIELDREVAIEAGGELLGRHQRVELALSPPVTLVALARYKKSL
jgi:diacylglycerol kinase family enzyme